MTVSSADIVRNVFDAFTRRDVERLIALADPEAEFWLSGTAAQAGRTGPYRGHAGIREYFADVVHVWQDIVLEPGDLRVAGQGVVAFGTARTHPVGQPDAVDVPVIWVFKLRDGKVLSVRAVATAAEAETALQAREAG